jgi:hypothetical protein
VHDHERRPLDTMNIGLHVIPNLVYRTQSKWFPLPRETFSVVIYTILGLFKMFFLVFNVIPYVALIIVG